MSFLLPLFPLTVIRKALPSDLHLIISLGRTTFYESFSAANTPEDMALYLDQAYRPDVILAELADPFQAYFLIEWEGEAAGFIKLRERSPLAYFEPDTAVELQRIYVRATHQNQGLGEQLLHFACDFGGQKGISLIWLGVWEKNLAAIRFYERQGFVPFSRHEFMLGNDLQFDVLMQKTL